MARKEGAEPLIPLLIFLFAWGAGLPLGRAFNVVVLCPATLILVAGFSLLVGLPPGLASQAGCLALIVGGLNLGYLCGCLCMPIQRSLLG